MAARDASVAPFAPARERADATEPWTSELQGVQEAALEAWVPPSWEDVVREHGNRVYRLAYRLTGNAHDAEDLTQDVFVRVFRSLADYTPGTFEGWLHRITTNLFLDRMRRQQKIRFDALPEDTERLAGREASPEAAYTEAHLDADIEAALAALPPDFRAAVVLCDIEQLSYEEIAQTLGVKLGTVRSRISRGRAMLRSALADRAPRPPASTRPMDTHAAAAASAPMPTRLQRDPVAPPGTPSDRGGERRRPPGDSAGVPDLVRTAPAADADTHPPDDRVQPPRDDPASHRARPLPNGVGGRNPRGKGA